MADELGIAYKRLTDFVKGNFYEDPVAEEEDRDVWAGFEARLDALIDAAKADPSAIASEHKRIVEGLRAMNTCGHCDCLTDYRRHGAEGPEVMILLDRAIRIVEGK